MLIFGDNFARIKCMLRMNGFCKSYNPGFNTKRVTQSSRQVSHALTCFTM